MVFLTTKGKSIFSSYSIDRCTVIIAAKKWKAWKVSPQGQTKILISAISLTSHAEVLVGHES